MSRLGLVGVSGGRFSRDSFMAGQSAGLWYDYIKTDRGFQESTGPTPAATAGDAIGLWFDQRQWNGQTFAQVLAAQSELVTNGTFDSDLTGWTNSDLGAGSVSSWDAGSGDGRLALPRADGSNIASRVQAVATVAGRIYCVSVRNPGANFSQVYVGSTSGGFQLLAILPLAGAATTSYYFVATGAVSYITVRGGTNGATSYVDNISVKLIPGIHAIQATGTLKPSFQLLGAKGDGSDDNLLPPYTAGVGANFLGVKNTNVPATLGATQVLLGASGAGANRCFLGIDTAGRACAGVGSDSTTTIVGTSDLRGTTASIFLTFDGTTVRLIVNGVVEYQAAQNSTPTTTIPFRVFGNNNNGTAGSSYGGYIQEVLVGREFITAATAVNLAR